MKSFFKKLCNLFNSPFKITLIAFIVGLCVISAVTIKDANDATIEELNSHKSSGHTLKRSDTSVPSSTSTITDAEKMRQQVLETNEKLEQIKEELKKEQKEFEKEQWEREKVILEQALESSEEILSSYSPPSSTPTTSSTPPNIANQETTSTYSGEYSDEYLEAYFKSHYDEIIDYFYDSYEPDVDAVYDWFCDLKDEYSISDEDDIRDYFYDNYEMICFDYMECFDPNDELFDWFVDNCNKFIQ